MEVKVFPDIPIDGSTKKADVYCPAVSSSPAPMLMYIHGGGHFTGSRRNGKHVCTELAKQGYVCVAPSYALSSLSNDQLQSIVTLVGIVLLALTVTSTTQAQLLFMLVLSLIILSVLVSLWALVPRDELLHPAHIRDIAKAYKWMHDHAAEYGGRSDWMAVMGHSAGGHLASLLSTNETYLKEVNLSLEDVKACVGISGVYSDKRLRQLFLGQQLLLNAFGDRPSYEDSFPIYNITDRTPPILLVNATSDISLKQHSFDFHYSLRDKQRYSEIVYFDASHFSIIREWSDGESHAHVKNKIVSFLREIEAG